MKKIFATAIAVIGMASAMSVMAEGSGDGGLRTQELAAQRAHAVLEKRKAAENASTQSAANSAASHDVQPAKGQISQG